MQSKKRILVVEDEESISNFIQSVLTANDYAPILATTGKQAESLAASYNPDLILLDLGLPDIDGIEVLKFIRSWSAVPLIVVSARGREQEKVEALDAGADDYVSKPFGISELLARIRSALRRDNQTGLQPGGSTEVFTAKDITVDLGKRTVTVGEREIHFTQIEFKIMALLCRYAGRVLTYDFIIKSVWGPHAVNDSQILRVNMANIRRKLEENPADPQYILTELGVGYRMLEE